jgi:hypothetical protein
MGAKAKARKSGGPRLLVESMGSAEVAKARRTRGRKPAKGEPVNATKAATALQGVSLGNTGKFVARVLQRRGRKAARKDAVPKPKTRGTAPVSFAEAVAEKLRSTQSRDFEGRTLLELLNHSFFMHVADLVELVRGYTVLPVKARLSQLLGQLSGLAGRVLEGHFLERNTLTWGREWDAAQAAIRELPGFVKDFVFAYRPLPGRLAAFSESLAESGLFPVKQGVYVQWLSGVREGTGELTDGVTLVIDVRNPERVTVDIVGLRESKLESVIEKLREQIPKDLKRLLKKGGLVVAGVSLDDPAVEVRISRHLVVSLLTEGKLSDEGLRSIRRALRRRTGSDNEPSLVDATPIANSARQIAAATLGVAGDKRFEKLLLTK